MENVFFRKHTGAQLFQLKRARITGNIDGILSPQPRCYVTSAPRGFPPSSDPSGYLDVWYSHSYRGRSAGSGAEWERGHVRGKLECREEESIKAEGSSYRVGYTLQPHFCSSQIKAYSHMLSSSPLTFSTFFFLFLSASPCLSLCPVQQ